MRIFKHLSLIFILASCVSYPTKAKPINKEQKKLVLRYKINIPFKSRQVKICTMRYLKSSQIIGKMIAERDHRIVRLIKLARKLGRNHPFTNYLKYSYLLHLEKVKLFKDRSSKLHLQMVNKYFRYLLNITYQRCLNESLDKGSKKPRRRTVQI